MNIYTIYYKRTDNDKDKRDTTHVVAKDFKSAINLFEKTRPNCAIESTYHEGDDIIIEGFHEA
jgi:hypothetical protein